MCMVDGADGGIFLSRVERRAIKPHRCMECGREIARGEKYLREVTLCEGDVYTYKTCAHCEAARSWLMVQCGGWLYQGVLEDLEEHWDEGEGRSLWLGRVIVNMRRGWRDARGLVAVPTRAVATS